MSVRRPRLATVGMMIAGSLVAIAILGPELAPYDARAVVGPSLSAPSGTHLLGTNDAGQDLASQLLVGTRVSLVTGLVAAAAATVMGVIVGATAGLARGRFDAVAMRIVDVFLAVPALPLMILVGSLVGPSRPTVVVLIALAGWPPIARVVRSQSLVLAGRGFVGAARGFGGGRGYLVRRHLVPGLAPLIVATFVNWAAVALVLDAGLAFLGIGDPTGVSWGSILERALSQERIYATGAWLWWVLPTGLAVTLAATSLTFVGVGLEPRGNPRSSRR